MEHLSSLPHGAVVFTTRQTAGRGQAGRGWCSDAGVLTASFILDLPDPSIGPRLALAAGLALCHAIEDELGTDIGCRIKWPNDVYLQDRKLAGLLCEGRFLAGGLRAVVGIGCNCDPQWNDLPPDSAYTGGSAPISLRAISDHPPTPRKLLPGIRRYLREAAGLLAAGGFCQLIGELRERHWLRGLAVRLQDGQDVIADEVLDDGRLQVVLPDGGHLAIDSSLAIHAIHHHGVLR